MKFFFTALMFSTLFLCSSCEKDEEIQPFPCEILGQEIQDILDSRIITKTWITQNGVFLSIEGKPSIDGCLLTIETYRYNLDQLVNYNITSGSSILRLSF